MESPYSRLADIINSRPFIVAGIIITILVIALYGTSLLTMETGSDTYIDKNTQQGALLAEYTDTFSSDSIMLIIETDDVTNPDVLEYIDRLESDLRKNQYISGASSIVTLLTQANGGVLPTSKAEVDSIKESASPEVIERYLPSDMMAISVLTLVPGLSQDVQNSLLDNIDSVIEISDMPPGVSVTVTGTPAFQKEMGEEIGTSMGTLIGAAMLLMVLAVGLLFSHVRYRFLPVFVVAAGLILTFGIMGLAGIPISMVVVGAFPVLIGIGIDYAIQFQSRFDEEVSHSTIPEAVKTTVVHSGPSIFFAMLATSLGFLAMFVSPVPMIGDFGFTCTIGVFSCYLSALFIVPTFGVIVKYRPKEIKPGAGLSSAAVMHKYDAFLGGLAEKIARHPVSVILLFSMVAIVGLQLDQTIPINTNEDSFVPPDMPAIVDLKKVTRTMGSTSTLPIYVRGDYVLDMDSLTWIKEFSEYEVSGSDKILSATSIVTYLMQYNGGVMPKTNAEVQEVLAKIPDSTKDRYLSGGMQTIIQFSLVDMENEVAQSVVDDIKKDLQWKYPPAGITATPTGTIEMFTDLIQKIKASKTTMTLIGFALILAFLLIIYRRIDAISPLIPIVMIVGWNGLIMYLLNIDYSPMTAVLGSMTIGVASEYTILIMERYQEERARGHEVIYSIRRSVQKIGTAITVSGLTTVFGFSALLLSTFNIIQNFGVVTVITVGFSLIGGIIIMPAVLSVMGRFFGREKTGSAGE